MTARSKPMSRFTVACGLGKAPWLRSRHSYFRVVKGHRRCVRDPLLVRLLVLVQLRRRIGGIHGLAADRREAVDYVRWDLYEGRVLLAGEELVHFALRLRPLSVVVADDLCAALHDDEIVRLDLVVVPAFHDAGISDRNVDLREPLEFGPIGAQ